MTSTLGGDDPAHELSQEQKDKEEKRLRNEARKLLGKKKKEREKLLNRANEISREKAKRGHQGTD